MADLLFIDDDLEMFAGIKFPVCLCIDVSGSMMAAAKDGISKIKKINNGLKEFYNLLKNDEVTQYCAEIAIVTFGRDVSIVRNFSIAELQEAPELEAFGFTPVGEAVNLGLDLIEKRKQKYKEYGCTWYKPWIITITDGSPVGSSEEVLDTAKSRIANFACNKKVIPISIAIGTQNEETNRHISELGNGNFFTIKPENLKEFFNQLFNIIARFIQTHDDTIIDYLQNC